MQIKVNILIDSADLEALRSTQKSEQLIIAFKGLMWHQIHEDPNKGHLCGPHYCAYSHPYYTVTYKLGRIAKIPKSDLNEEPTSNCGMGINLSSFNSANSDFRDNFIAAFLVDPKKTPIIIPNRDLTKFRVAQAKMIAIFDRNIYFINPLKIEPRKWKFVKGYEDLRKTDPGIFVDVEDYEYRRNLLQRMSDLLR